MLKKFFFTNYRGGHGPFWPRGGYAHVDVCIADRGNLTRFELLFIQGDSDVFSIKQNLNSLHQGEHRFSQAFFTKVPHFRDNRKNVQF